MEVLVAAAALLSGSKHDDKYLLDLAELQKVFTGNGCLRAEEIHDH
jgi:hypothetical protein